MNITLEAIFTIAVALFLMAFFVPLMFRKIPMNRLYGFRTAESFKSENHWYDINANGGRIVVCALLPVLIVGVLKLFVSEATFPYLNILAFVLPVLIAFLMFRRSMAKGTRLNDKTQG